MKMGIFIYVHLFCRMLILATSGEKFHNSNVTKE